MSDAMNKKVDMTYSFLWDSEPTEEQLLVIMQEVAEEAQLNRKKMASMTVKNIEQESARLRSIH